MHPIHSQLFATDRIRQLQAEAADERRASAARHASAARRGLAERQAGERRVAAVEDRPRGLRWGWLQRLTGGRRLGWLP